MVAPQPVVPVALVEIFHLPLAMVETVQCPVVVVRERSRHDAGRRFRTERFGAE
jgi:hypothetical protein